MNLTPLQMMILGTCALVGYLTWSAIQGGAQLVDEGIPRVGGTGHRKSTVVVPAAHRGRDPFLKSSEIGKYDSDSDVVSDDEGSAPMRLTGVVAAGPRRIAYVDGRRLRVGDSYRGFEVERIEVNRVSLSGGGDRLDLWLDSIASAPETPGGGAPLLVRQEKDRIEIIHATKAARANGAVPEQPDETSAAQREEAVPSE